MPKDTTAYSQRAACYPDSVIYHHCCVDSTSPVVRICFLAIAARDSCLTFEENAYISVLSECNKQQQRTMNRVATDHTAGVGELYNQLSRKDPTRLMMKILFGGKNAGQTLLPHLQVL